MIKAEKIKLKKISVSYKDRQRERERSGGTHHGTSRRIRAHSDTQTPAEPGRNRWFPIVLHYQALLSVLFPHFILFVMSASKDHGWEVFPTVSPSVLGVEGPWLGGLPNGLTSVLAVEVTHCAVRSEVRGRLLRTILTIILLPE